MLSVQATVANSDDAARLVTWCKAYDGGRSFYTTLGHNATDYEDDENFRTMLQQAIIWAAEGDELVTKNPTEAQEEESTIVLYPNPVIDQFFVAAEMLADADNL